MTAQSDLSPILNFALHKQPSFCCCSLASADGVQTSFHTHQRSQLPRLAAPTPWPASVASQPPLLAGMVRRRTLAAASRPPGPLTPPAHPGLLAPQPHHSQPIWSMAPSTGMAQGRLRVAGWFHDFADCLACLSSACSGRASQAQALQCLPCCSALQPRRLQCTQHFKQTGAHLHISTFALTALISSAQLAPSLMGLPVPHSKKLVHDSNACMP